MPDAFGLYPGAAPAQAAVAPAAQSNVLSNPATLLDLALKANQLQSTTQEIQARNAIGQIYKKNIRPDGTLDEHGAIRDIATEPTTAWKAPEAVGGMLQRQGQALQNTGLTIQNQASQTELQAKQQKFAADSISTMVDPDKPTPEQITNWGVMFKRNNPNIPSAVINGLMQTALTDPEGLKHGVGVIRNFAIGPSGASERVTGPPEAGTGAPTTIAKAQANLAPGPITTANPPGTEKSAAILQADLEKAGNYGQEIYPWMQALEKVKALGPGGTAPGSKGRQELESFVYGLSPEFAKIIPGFDAGKIKNYAELEKYLTQATQMRAQGFGVHTDQGLATAIAGNPNVHINDLAVQDVVKSAIALRRMEHAQTIVNQGAGPVGYTATKSKWATTQDPVAYAVDLMDPEARTKYIKGLKGKALQRFNDSLQSAYSSGVIDRPGQPQAQQ